MNSPGNAAVAGREQGRPWLVAAFWVPLALYALGAIFYSRDLMLLATRWQETPGESHGWLVAAVVPALVWLQRHRLEPHGGRGRWIAALGLAGTAAATALARASGTDVVSALAFPATVYLASWLALGWPAARTLVFPFGYFLFAIPVWAACTPFLQWLTVKATTLLLALVGVSAHIHDSFVSVPSGTFEIQGGCSGLAFVVVGLATATLLAFIERQSWRESARLVLTVLGVAILSNWLRVTTVIYVGNATAMRSSLVRNHYAFGWWLFAAALVLYLLLARRFGGPSGEVDPGTQHASVPRVRLSVGLVVPAIAALAAGPLWARALEPAAPPAMARLELQVPAGWTGPQAPAPDWRPEFPGAAAERQASFSRGPARVGVYLAYYDRQRPGQKLIGYRSRVSGADWHEVSVAALPVTGAVAAAVTERVLADGSARERLVWSWYEVHGVRVLNPVAVKLRQSLSAFGAPSGSGIVALSARCGEDCADARRALHDAYESGLGRLSATPVPLSATPVPEASAHP